MKFFISHSKKDNYTVYQVLKILGDKKISHWVDLKQIGINSEINKEINRAICSSSHFLLIWSKNANKSKFVEREYNAVTTPDYNGKLEMIIVRLDDTPLPPLLSDKKYDHVTDISLEETIEKLVYEIRESQITDIRYKKFDEYLDVNFGNISIAEHKYLTSFALKQIDEQIYKEDMMYWLDSLNEEKN